MENVNAHYKAFPHAGNHQPTSMPQLMFRKTLESFRAALRGSWVPKSSGILMEGEMYKVKLNIQTVCVLLEHRQL